MSEYHPGDCTICGSFTAVRYIDLYVIGSEGLKTCHPCEMKLVEFARKLMQENGRRKLESFKQQKAEKVQNA